MPYTFNPFTNNLDVTSTIIVPPGTVAGLEGNTGGEVGPTIGGVINIIGDGITTNVVGNPGTNTLTISTIAGGGFIRTLTGQTGGAVPPSAPPNDNIDIEGDGVFINVTGDIPSNTITISGIPQIPLWNIIAASQTLTINSNYFLNGGGGTIFLALPAASAIGSTISISNISALSPFQITQGTGQSVLLGNVASTTGATGYISSSELGSSLTMVCYADNESWAVVSSVGDFLIN